LKFAFIGNGRISERHKKAIEKIGGEIVQIYDPLLSNVQKIEHLFKWDFEYVVICSPNYLHYEHIKLCLDNNRKVIVEKPMILPWQNVIDDDRINIVLQFRWLDLPKEADVVEVVMPRNKKYMKTWKGDSRLTGGHFYNMFIHYIDLALLLDARFEGKIVEEGKAVRKIDNFDLLNIDMDLLYEKMYRDIVFEDKGVKPKDIMFLNWWLERISFKYGFSSNIFDKKIVIENML